MADQPNETGQRLATTLRARRAELGWTQERVADEAGVARQTVIRYESGAMSNPEGPTLRKICTAIDLDVREVLIDLGYVTREELGLPPREPELGEPILKLAGLWRMDLPEAVRRSLLRHVDAAIDLWADSMGVKIPPRKPKNPVGTKR